MIAPSTRLTKIKSDTGQGLSDSLYSQSPGTQSLLSVNTLKNGDTMYHSGCTWWWLWRLRVTISDWRLDNRGRSHSHYMEFSPIKWVSFADFQLQHTQKRSSLGKLKVKNHSCQGHRSLVIFSAISLLNNTYFQLNLLVIGKWQSVGLLNWPSKERSSTHHSR